MRFDVSKAYIIIYYIIIYLLCYLRAFEIRIPRGRDGCVRHCVAGDTHSVCREKLLFCAVRVLKSSSRNNNITVYIILLCT